MAERPDADPTARDGMDTAHARAQLHHALFGTEPAPLRIGRFEVLERLGSGGSGVVYAGHDPVLDRKIALKLIRRELLATIGPDARERLLREAQTLAKLAHPNVVGVFDVGFLATDSGPETDLYIAMELVEGRTLSHWLDQAPRSWREIVAVFVEAGRGLAAAHAVGVVHCDFKPTNVMIGADGRVRVLDFGIARAEAGTTASGSGATEATGASEGSSLLEGTPPYMAPEQHRRYHPDARSDQYGFFVSLWEALHGARPFPGRKLEELLRRKLEGPPRDPPRRRATPRRLHRALVRGLAADPADRFSDMDAALAALAPPGRARVLWLAAPIALAGASLAVWQLRREDPCAAAAAEVAAVWNDGVKGDVRAMFLATEKPYAEAAADGVARALDRHAAVLADARTQACRSGASEGGTEHLERRICLDGRLKRLTELVAVFRSADAEVVAHALSAATGLPDPTECESAREGTGATDETLERLLARAHAMIGTGRDALPLAEEAVALAEQLGDRNAELGALFVLGDAQRAGRDPKAALATQRRAFTLAESLGDPRRFAAAHIELIEAEGRLGDGEAALQLVGRTRELLHEAGDPPQLVAQLEHAMGLLHLGKREYDQAIVSFETALALAREALGDNHPNVGGALSNLAAAHGRRGDRERAIELLREALATQEAAYGPDHPAVAKAMHNLAGELAQARRHDEADMLLERSFATLERALGVDHPDLALALSSLATVDERRSDFAAAQAHSERAITLIESAYGVDAKDLAYMRGQLGGILLARGDAEAALEQGRQAERIATAGFGEDSRQLGVPLLLQAEALVALGRHAAAEALARRALDIYAHDPPKRAAVAHARFVLAQALAHRDRAEARALAKQARDSYSELGDEPERAEEVDRWLAELAATK